MEQNKLRIKRKYASGVKHLAKPNDDWEKFFHCFLSF